MSEAKIDNTLADLRAQKPTSTSALCGMSWQSLAVFENSN